LKNGLASKQSSERKHFPRRRKEQCLPFNDYHQRLITNWLNTTHTFVAGEVWTMAAHSTRHAKPKQCSTAGIPDGEMTRSRRMEYQLAFLAGAR
jgi:hypothetical protein